MIFVYSSCHMSILMHAYMLWSVLHEHIFYVFVFHIQQWSLLKLQHPNIFLFTFKWLIIDSHYLGKKKKRSLLLKAASHILYISLFVCERERALSLLYVPWSHGSMGGPKVQSDLGIIPGQLGGCVSLCFMTSVNQGQTAI